MREVDPKYLLIFLLENLHQELNKDNNSNQSNKDYIQLEKDSYNEKKALKNFFKE